LYTSGEFIDYTSSVNTAITRAIEKFVVKAQASGYLEYVK
jgi:hypothetical protein